MSGLESGRWNDPSKKFIPIDEVSAEHVAAGYEMPVPPTPEDIALGLEATEEPEWEEWLAGQFGHDFNDELDIFDETDPAEEAKEEVYWDRLGKIEPQFQTFEERGETFEDFKEQYDLPEQATRKDMERLFARERKYRSAHSSQANEIHQQDRRFRANGPRGKEPLNKHLKGSETLRRPDDTLLN
jgi:hypothetical protein